MVQVSGAGATPHARQMYAARILWCLGGEARP